jgi:hypothetical protein
VSWLRRVVRRLALSRGRPADASSPEDRIASALEILETRDRQRAYNEDRATRLQGMGLALGALSLLATVAGVYVAYETLIVSKAVESGIDALRPSQRPQSFHGRRSLPIQLQRLPSHVSIAIRRATAVQPDRTPR